MGPPNEAERKMPLGLEMHQRYFLLAHFLVILFSCCCCCGDVSAKFPLPILIYHGKENSPRGHDTKEEEEEGKACYAGRVVPPWERK